jgi:hypothetical protein
MSGRSRAIPGSPVVRYTHEAIPRRRDRSGSFTRKCHTPAHTMENSSSAPVDTRCPTSATP